MFPDIKLQPTSLLIAGLVTLMVLAQAMTVNSSTLQPLNLAGCQQHKYTGDTAATDVRWRIDQTSRWPKAYDAWLDEEMIV